MNPLVAHWQRTLEKAIVLHATQAWCQRVVVLEECLSTQDEAFQRATGEAGLAVLAMRQIAGRGRLGRTWTHVAEHGLAVTFVLDPREHDALRLPLRAGLASMRACEAVLGSGKPKCALRWPNDVVERMPHTPDDGHNPVRRKLAGVLVEQRAGLMMLGIGINVSQAATDFPDELRRSATSLRMLSLDERPLDRLLVAIELMRNLHPALHEDPAALARAWKAADMLVGTVQTFEHDARRVTGVVESIEPDSHIAVRTEAGELMRLPAVSTSLVKDAGL